MTPDFALTLSHAEIGLAQRTPQGWRSLGAVSLSDPALDSGLAALRARAEAICAASGRVFCTKVVLPDAEVLVTRLAPPPPGADPDDWVARGIDGMTPYPVADLAFDWQPAPDGGMQVAVAAREILAEAEAFADAHRFNPVAVVGLPRAAPAPDGADGGAGGAGVFPAEPFFGPTRAARRLLAPDEMAERDTIPLPRGWLPPVEEVAAAPRDEADAVVPRDESDATTPHGDSDAATPGDEVEVAPTAMTGATAAEPAELINNSAFFRLLVKIASE
mgnify:FL=1